MYIHEFEMNEIEFSSYLLGMRTNILLEPAIDILEGDLIILQETDNQTGQRKGKYLTFRIIGIDRNHGCVNEFIIWNIALKRIVNYDKLKDDLCNDELNIV